MIISVVGDDGMLICTCSAGDLVSMGCGTVDPALCVLLRDPQTGKYAPYTRTELCLHKNNVKFSRKLFFKVLLYFSALVITTLYVSCAPSHTH